MASFSGELRSCGASTRQTGPNSHPDVPLKLQRPLQRHCRLVIVSQQRTTHPAPLSTTGIVESARQTGRKLVTNRAGFGGSILPERSAH